MMVSDFSLHHFRFHLEPKNPLHLPAYNKRKVIRAEGLGARFGESRVIPTAGIRRLAISGACF